MAAADQPRVRRRTDADLRSLRGGAAAFRAAALDVYPSRADELIGLAERNEAEIAAELAQREAERNS
ncbi:hypothetical protein ACFXI6_14365 [Streptomyces mirabilis]|uniref:hypothetical protein n=1 Tax=Streptomyces mirabilis TaxID=68239 RepID=UPI00368D5ED3